VASTMTSKVVIADDDPDIRALVAIAVGRAGMSLVAEEGDGDAAWDAIRKLRPDVAILDVAMPGKSGLEICQLVRADSSLDSVHVLLLSASADENSIANGLAAGAADYLSKPFSPRKLVENLVEYAGGAA
jgi:DNA-binding response OmpR family regulator